MLTLALILCACETPARRDAGPRVDSGLTGASPGGFEAGGSETAVPGGDTGGGGPAELGAAEAGPAEVEQLPDPTPGDPPPLCALSLRCDGAIRDEPEVGCDLEVRGGDGTLWYSGRAGLELRGRSSMDFPKPQYGLELWGADGEPRDADLLGMGDEDDWILDGAWIDRALFRDKLAYDLFQSFGGPERYAPEAAFCELSLDGRWVGIYLLTERVVRDGERVDIPADPGDGSSFIVYLDDEPGIRDNTGGSGTWQLVYPDPDRVGQASADGVIAWLDGYYEALAAGTPGDLERWVDIESAVDFVLLQELVRNNDAYYLSVYLWRSGEDPMRFAPWDLDLSLGQPSYNDNENPEGFVAYRPSFIAALGRDPAFAEALAARWTELREGPLSDAVIDRWIEGYLETTAPAVEANFEVWPIDEVRFGWGGEDYLYEVDSYEEEIERVRTWLARRLVWLDENIGTW